MRHPFIAVDAGTDLRAHARLLRRSWEATLGGAPAAACVRPVIQRSWMRMTGAGLDPDHLHPTRALEPEALETIRAASPLSRVMPALRKCLGALAEDAEHVLVVTDATGRILWIEGDDRVKDRAQGITFAEGMLWTEGSAGTNAIGTALAIEHAVQIFSAEHFLAEQHAWWCSAAPIRDPASGGLLGIVDLSGPMRTAHPHSLALVMAAAERAEDVLRFEQAVHEDRLRQRYLQRTAQSDRARTALVDDGGRVLMSQPHGWAPATLDVPREGGELVLAGGRTAVAESLEEGGFVVRVLERPGPHPGRPAMRLELLGRPATLAFAEAPPLELSLRHAEILALLALHPDGLTAEQLTLHLYGEQGNRISARAEISRLRKLLGPFLAARPYRLDADLEADFLEVEERLAAGRLDAALDGYRGPLLAESEAPRVVQARDELDGALRSAALAGSLGGLWRWLQCEPGRDDARALEDFLRRAHDADPRRAVAAARLHSLRERWGLTGAGR